MANTERRVLLSSSPHFYAPTTARRLMANVLMALAPAAAYGVVLFGLPALFTIATSVAVAVVSEAAFRKAVGEKPRFDDLSAIVTGLLLAMVIPPSTPLWMTALGSMFAIVVAKEFFGGLGANVFNPALIGRAFLLMSFPAALTTWHKPFGALVDATTTATPLNVVKLGGTIADVGKGLADSGLAASAGYGDMLKALVLGNRAGCIGESSILLILAGALFLLVTKTIDWRAPLAMITATFLASLALGMDPVFGIFSGGVMFGAVFMITDYVSAPVTPIGKLIFGACAGLITVMIRKFGGYPEGVTYAILIMNAIAPFLNKIVEKKYGFVAPKKEASK
ncbi:MAG: RnfABCDGE type electron transport complex subunit D [Treponemataceae bacterium]